MQDELLREEIPIQSVQERNQDCTATVPVHLDILSLSSNVRTDISVIADARNTVAEWFNEDMDYYRYTLRRQKFVIPGIKPYSRFNSDWEIGGVPNTGGFLSLFFNDRVNNYKIELCQTPVTFQNRHDELGVFYTPEIFKKGDVGEFVYRSLDNPDVVLFSPEKMRKYGVETPFHRIDTERGLAEVVGRAFCSDYDENIARALLLRNFAVFYLNQLLSLSKKV